MTGAPPIPTLIRPLRGHLPPGRGKARGRGNGILPSRLRRATSLSQGRLMSYTIRPPCQRGLASPLGDDWRIPTQQLPALRRSPHPPLRGTFPQGKAFGTEKPPRRIPRGFKARMGKKLTSARPWRRPLPASSSSPRPRPWTRPPSGSWERPRPRPWPQPGPGR